MALLNQLISTLKELVALAGVARSGGDLKAVADLVDRLIDSPQMVECLRRCREEVGGAAMIDGRYPPLQPDLAFLGALPKGSLGQCYALAIAARQCGHLGARV